MGENSENRKNPTKELLEEESGNLGDTGREESKEKSILFKDEERDKDSKKTCTDCLFVVSNISFGWNGCAFLSDFAFSFACLLA